MKRIISIFLCVLVCLSFSSAFATAASVDEDELPGIVIDPDNDYFYASWEDIVSVALTGSGLQGGTVCLEQSDEVMFPYEYYGAVHCPAGTQLSFLVMVTDRYGNQWMLSSSHLKLGEYCDLDQVNSYRTMDLSIDEGCNLLIYVTFDPTDSGNSPSIGITKRKEPAPTRDLIVMVPEAWKGVYAYTRESEEALGEFPGTKVSRTGLVYAMRIDSHIQDLIISTPDPEGGYRQTTDILLENNGLDATITIAEDGSYRVIYATTGDVTGDGELNLGDVARLYAHLRGSKLLTDPKALLHADFTGEGRLNMGDVAKLYAHIRITLLDS